MKTGTTAHLHGKRQRHFDEMSSMWECDVVEKFYRNNRENGSDEDSPKDLKLIYDGKISKIDIGKENKVHGIRKKECFGDKEEYDYELRYEAGIEDKSYFKAKDRNYLTRIADEGNLQTLEPAVWLLYETYLHDTNDIQKLNIADWWSTNVDLKNIAEILDDALTRYNQNPLNDLISFWENSPIDICKIIANDYVVNDKLKLDNNKNHQR
jgi:hypothetical protein